MSDSEGSPDDASIEESECDAEADSIDERQFSEIEETQDLDDDDADSKWQKEVWQLRFLPYADELESQADDHFRHIKTGLAHSLIMRDMKPGFVHWACELDKYIALYSRRFTKEDHIGMVKLFYGGTVLKGADYRFVKICAQTLSNLLGRRDLLTRDDIQLDWRPLYDVYVDLAYKNLEEDGVLLLPEGIKSTFEQTIVTCRCYFSLTATREILDEVRPYMCPWDESMNRAMTVMILFIPTTLTVEQNMKYGSGLWFDEMWHWFTSLETNFSCETKLILLFVRLSRDCPSCIDWHDKYDVVITRILRAMNLELGQGPDRVCISWGRGGFSLQNAALWICCLLGGPDNGIQNHLTRLLRTIEPYLHPSNYGAHSASILFFLMKLSSSVAIRIRKERYDKPRWHVQIPAALRLTNAQLDEFVESMLPCVQLALFTKYKLEYVPSLVRSLACIAPRIVVPAILDVIYPALETVTEPHRLLQSLNGLVAVCLALVRDDSNLGNRKRRPLQIMDELSGKPYRSHAISLLNALLPGLDPNDPAKMVLTFQVINLLTTLVPIVDCSEAIHVRDDLNEEEKEICSATANFEDIVASLLNRMFDLVGSYAGTLSNVTSLQNTLAKSQQRLSIEETLITRGVFSVFRSICGNCSTSICQIAVDKLYEFVTTTIHDSRVAADIVGDLIYCAVRTAPELSLERFTDYLLGKLSDLISDDIYKEEELDVALIWYLVLASALFRTDGVQIVKRKEKMLKLLRLMMPLSCKNASDLFCVSLVYILHSLTNIYTNDKGIVRQLLDQPVEKYLPIRHWAKAADRRSLKVNWHVPSDEEINFAQEILDEFFFPMFEKLAVIRSLDKRQLLKSLKIVASCVSGASAALPPLSGELLPLCDPSVRVHPFIYVAAPSSVKNLSYRGENIRNFVVEKITDIAKYMLSERENHTDSLNVICTLLDSLLFERGADRDKFSAQFDAYSLSKRFVSDLVKGSKANIEPAVLEYIMLLHNKRLLMRSGHYFTVHHLNVMKLLVKLGTSSYSSTRICAQRVLDMCTRNFPYSYLLIIDDILSYLNNSSDVTHEQFKGALYMILNGKRMSLCVRQNWEALLKLWPALVKAEHSDKPSEIALIDTAQNIIVENFESFQIKFELPEEMVMLAKSFLSVGDNNKFQPAWTMPNEEQIALAIKKEAGLCKERESQYSALCLSLVELAMDTNRHWRHPDMAQSLLSLLLRRDMPYPADAVRLFVRLLACDTMKTRRLSAGLISAWLRITKTKAIKIPFENPVKAANVGPGAVWPIKYGYREDNIVILYDSESAPCTADQWNSTTFFGKTHWGFYTWPKKLLVYAPANEQINVNRKFDELDEIERSVVEILRDEEFVEKLCSLMSVDEKKDEAFLTVEFRLFCGLFRNYNDMLLPVFKKQLEKLISSDKPGHHRLAAEMVAGLVHGSKLWTFEKLSSVWEWLEPLLYRCFETIATEIVKNWGTAIATIFTSVDPKALKWLIEMLFSLCEKPTESSFHASTRLYFLQGALNQCEWRTSQLWNRLLEYCMKTMDVSYHNLRERIGSTLCTITWFDIPCTYIDPRVPTKFHPPKLSDVMHTISSKMGLLWLEVAAAKGNGESVELTENDSSSVGDAEMNGNGRKKALSAFKTALDYMNCCWTQSYTSLPPEIFNVLPLLLHFENESRDEELKKSCHSQLRMCMSQALVNASRVEMVIAGVKELSTSSPNWWKAKISLLKYLQVAVFSNIFVFLHHRAAVQSVVCSLLIDSQFEVREVASQTLAGLIQCHFCDVDQSLIETFDGWSHEVNGPRRHAGVLALSAIVLAFPYTVPSFLPEILMKLCPHASDDQPIQATVKKALNEFKRTHQDSWHEHKTQFSEDQLSILTDLLVSPTYYV